MKPIKTFMLALPVLLLMLISLTAARAETEPGQRPLTTLPSLTIYETGEPGMWNFTPVEDTPLFQAVFGAINSAIINIDFMAYDWGDHPMLNQAIQDALDRGVEIRFIVDYAHRDRFDTIFAMVGTGGNVIDWVTDCRTSAQFHNKTIDIDDQRLLTGSMNFTPNGVGWHLNNLADWDTPVMSAAYQPEFDQIWSGTCGHAKEDESKTVLVDDEVPVDVIFGPKHPSAQALTDFVNSAMYSINITAFWISTSADIMPFVDALIAQAQAGIDIRVILDAGSCNSQYGADDILRAGGVSVKCEIIAAKVHKKTIEIDGQCLWIGSMNFSGNGVRTNAENANQFCDVAKALEARDRFNAIWNVLPEFTLWYTSNAEAGYGPCSNNVDDNYNGPVDENDPNCDESYSDICMDGIDNDGDGHIDGGWNNDNYVGDYDCWWFYPKMTGYWLPTWSSTLPQSFISDAPYSMTCAPFSGPPCENLPYWTALASNCNGCYWVKVPSNAFYFNIWPGSE